MPTADRRQFIGTAIGCFLGQDYSRRTLVVVDDGADAVEDLMPDDPAVHYHRRAPGMPLGAKRNLACDLADGDIVVHWDDDWSASWRVSYQVAELLDSGADVCGLATLLFRDVDGGRAYRYRYPQNGGWGWVAGATMAYRREFWRRNPFPAVRSGEDTRFLWTPLPKRVLALPDDSFYVATIHRSNTSTRRPSGSRWKAVPMSEVERVMQTDERPTDRGTRPPAVTLSLPYHRAGDTIVGAVESVLSQTHRDLRLVVVNDGDPHLPWPLLEHVDDERLVRFDLDANRGRCFADAVVLAATDSPWFGVQDADDWSEPERVARYLVALRERHAEFAVGAQWLHAEGRVSVETNDRVLEPLSERMRHIGHHCGLAGTDVLRSIGGIHPGYRFGYDTLLVNLLRMAAPVAHVAEPLHHRRRHGGSLTSSPETGIGSPARLAAQRRLSALYQRARRCHQDYLAGEIDRAELRRRIGRLIRDDDVDPGTATAVGEAAARLRQVLTAPVPRPIAVASRERITVQEAPRSPAVDLGVLLDRAELWSDPCAVARETALELAAYLSGRRPRRVLECGSGASTAVLARYALEATASVVVLEHDRRRAAQTRGLLRGLGLGSGVEVVDTGLTRRRWADGGEHAWYDHALDGDFDFVFVHGPPAAGGRVAAPFALRPHLTGNGEVWIDDGRGDEVRYAAMSQELGVDVHLLPVSPNGLLRVRPAAAVRRSTVDGREVTVTLLTGQRPRLLERTVSALLASAPGLLETGHVVVQVNSQDEETVGLVEDWDWVDELRVHSGSLLSIGDGTSALMARAAAACRPYVLHLEDDWVAGTADGSWLGRAREVLDRNHDVGQVRLRHRGERVLPRHMVTGRPIRWADRDGWAFAPVAHFTFNPGLVRRADLGQMFPSPSQDAAQRRFLAARFATAQLSPGVFHHIGVESLRRRQDGGTPGASRRMRVGAHL